MTRRDRSCSFCTTLYNYYIFLGHHPWFRDQTIRRDIMWSEELCAAFEQWGQKIVSRIGKLSRDPLRKTTKELFFKTGRVEERVREKYPSKDDQVIRRQALDIAEILGKTISRAEAEDEEVVKPLVDLSIMIAPTVTLDDAMRKASEEGQTTLSAIISLLRTARIAELLSFGKVAEQRIKVIERLEKLKNDNRTTEPKLQKLIEGAPWLINPEWAPVTANRTLSTLRKEFEEYYNKKTTGEPIFLSNFDDTEKRPDFVLLNYNNRVQIVEIKRPGHALTNEEMDRIINYGHSMKNFLQDPTNEPFKKIVNDFHITLICDDIKLTGARSEELYEGYVSRGILTHISWSSFLLSVKEAHSDFLEAAEKTFQTIVSKDE